MTISQPLEGVRVLDLTRLLPGPLATMFMGDLGAEVIKIESPASPDPTRFLPPLKSGVGMAYLALNRSKLSLALNLKDPEGLDIFRTLLTTSDIVVEGFRPGVMERLGLSFEQLRLIKSDIILCSISGYGQSGPDRKRAGHDIDYCARTGILAATGGAKSSPVVPGAQFADVLGGSWQALTGILGALYYREKTKQGQWIDISMTDGMLTPMILAFTYVFSNEKIPPIGEAPLTGGLPCYGIYRTSDGRYMAVGSLEPQFFDRLCDTLGCPHLKGAGLTQGERGEEIKKEIAEIFLKCTQKEWTKRFREVDACVEPINELDKVISDPLFQDRQMFFSIDCPGVGEVMQLQSPLKFFNQQMPKLPPPRLGEHTERILDSVCGINSEQIKRLVNTQTIGVK